MEQNINKQLDIIKESNNWINTWLDGSKQKDAYRKMVNCRRKLNKKKIALEGNPAAAMYGESQVGKSYLISSLLSEENKPFSITDENNVVHNFIEEINPPGGGNESTSLVSRFSVSYKPINSKFPVKAILLSPADIVLVLCDSFYNDIKADHSLILQTAEIDSTISSFKNIFKDRQSQQNIFEEDDVLDMQDYFKENFSTKASNILFSVFFDEISLIISKVKPNEWKDIFALLWNKNEKFTTLFDMLISEYEKLNFSNIIYLPLESVLYKHGTLLDVKRLKEIDAIPNKLESEYKSDTKVLLPDNKEIMFQKSYLCALAAELVFCQQETLIESKPFLKETDLLDFPGARGRMTLPQNEINNENIPELLIRGKVAYLFNKYSDFEKISIFVLCAKHEQAAQRSMPEMLNNWINKFIGDTPEKREIFIRNSKIPPLFIIGTFFNVNLEYNPLQDRENNLSSLNYRWNQRFERTLSVELLNTETYQWFNNWTKSAPNFQNIFFLRDFVYSESKSQIFKGFLEHKKEMEEINPTNYPDFRKKLKQSFLEYDFVKRHFENPEESWDRAASMNEDGTQLIIDKLTIAANNINNARREKTIAELKEIKETVIEELNRHFHDGNKADEIIKAKKTAADIQLKLDLAFKADGIKMFGQMMKDFMINEGEVLKLYRQEIDNIERKDVVNMDKYSMIRLAVPNLNANDSDEINKERLFKKYEKTTEEEKQKFLQELDNEGIILEELFKGNEDRLKNNSQQLAEALIEYYLKYIIQNDKRMLKQLLSDEALQNIADMFRKLFKKLKINKIIAEKIRHYVDGYTKIESAYEMIADISAEILNSCINNIGMEYFSESDFKELKEANEQNNLELNWDEHLQNSQNKQETIEELFIKIDNLTDLINKNPDEIKTLPNYHNYKLWTDRLKFGFVSVCDIPTYNVKANEKLGIIINECNNIKYCN